MIKIAHIISTLTYGGSIKYVLDILNYSQKFDKSFKKYLIILKKPEYDLYDKIPKSVEVLQCSIKTLKSFNFLNQFIKIIRFVKTNNITIIHTHDSLPNFIGAIVGTITSSPAIVSTQHTLEEFRNNVSFNNYISRLKDFIRLKKTDSIIVISKDVSNYLLKYTRYSENKLYFIPHGIDINKFNNSKYLKLSNKTDVIKVAFIGRFSEEKGHIFFLDLLKKFNKRINKFHFFFAGDGKLKNEIRNKISSYSLNKYITLLGNIDYIPDLLKSVDLLVIPSKYEGFGLVAIEAMAAGIPVIANHTSGIRDIVINNKSGYLIESNNIEEWIKIFKNLNKNKLKKMGLFAQKKANKTYKIERMINNTYKFYKCVLENKYGHQTF